MIVYEPLYERVKESNMLWGTLQGEINCSSATIAKLRQGYPVSLHVINRLCKFFKCPVEGIIQYREESA